jgi:hypothetical protein
MYKNFLRITIFQIQTFDSFYLTSNILSSSSFLRYLSSFLTSLLDPSPKMAFINLPLTRLLLRSPACRRPKPGEPKARERKHQESIGHAQKPGKSKEDRRYYIERRKQHTAADRTSNNPAENTTILNESIIKKWEK